MSSIHIAGLDEESRNRYFEKLNYKGEMLPDPLDDNLRDQMFSCDLKKLPNLHFGDLFIYLVHQNVYTPKQLKNYKALESYNFFLSGKIRHLKVYRNSTLRVCVIYCEVQASQTLSKFHKSWAVIECSGIILNAHCTCMAGLGETCSHVAALFFFVETAVREGLNNPSGTSLPCTWRKVCCKKVDVIPLSEISYGHKSRDKPVIKKKDQHLPSKEAYKTFEKLLKDNHPDAPYFSLVSDSEGTDTSSES